jgi:hypothetical protein
MLLTVLRFKFQLMRKMLFSILACLFIFKVPLIFSVMGGTGKSYGALSA